MDRILGIDLGTSTSEVAIWDQGKPNLIPNDRNKVIIPSVVGLSDKGQVIVGQDARDQLLIKPDETVMEIKRIMGTNQTVKLGDKVYTPQEISALILSYLKNYSEDYLKDKVSRAVITVPAYFTDEQRKATIEAGKLAGLRVERIINEPTAAALAYGLEHIADETNILVYDLGGGTLDVTVLEMFSGVLEVKASSGNTTLGGKDFDQRLMDMLSERFHAKNGIALQDDSHALARLKDAAEACKIALSTQEEYRVLLPFIAASQGEPLSLDETVTREEFEILILDLVTATAEPIENALADAGLTKDEIQLVLPIGGTTRVPLVQKFLTETMGQEPRPLVDPDLAVVQGAAIQGAILNKELSGAQDLLITDVCPYTLGTSTITHIGGVLIKDYFDVLIPRNTTIPVSKEGTYYTVADNQKQVEITAYQGDYKQASLNNLLGKFMLSGIPPAPAGDEGIKIRFTYDNNGILQVDASIISTGKKASITIETASQNLEPEVDYNLWKEAPQASKFRALIRRAERRLKSKAGAPQWGELDGLILDLKKALIKNANSEILEDLAEDLNSLLYEMEEA